MMLILLSILYFALVVLAYYKIADNITRVKRTHIELLYLNEIVASVLLFYSVVQAQFNTVITIVLSLVIALFASKLLIATKLLEQLHEAIEKSFSQSTFFVVRATRNKNKIKIEIVDNRNNTKVIEIEQ